MRADPRTRYTPSTDAGRATESKGKKPFPVLAGLLIVFVLVAGWLALRWRNEVYLLSIAPEVIQQLDGDGQILVSRLQRDACNRDASTDLASKLLKLEEYSAVIGFHQGRVARCGESDQLLSTLYFAQMGLAKYSDASESAGKLIDAFPADPNPYGWRANAEEKLSNFNDAYSDMRKALARFMDPSNVTAQTYYDTAQMAAKAGHQCDAVVILRDYIAFDAAERRTQQLTTMMDEWRTQGSCQAEAATGTASVSYDSQLGGFVASVDINGTTARMLLDTGATVTLLSAELAERANIRASNELGGPVSTANGVV